MNDPFPYLSIFYNLEHSWIIEITNNRIHKQLRNLSFKNIKNICFIKFLTNVEMQEESENKQYRNSSWHIL